jgi:hypothetical protein
MNRPQWIALYNDESVLPQYKDDGTERLYGEIEHDKLIRFVLELGGKAFCVDLRNGSFFIDKQQFTWAGFDERISFRLIYFRRVRQIMGMGSTPQRTEVVYHLGWQATLNNQNCQRVMAIAEDGSVSVLIK